MSDVIMDIKKVKEVLPHREPFLLVDAVIKLEENLIEAYRDVKPEEFYFAGHFPGYPVLPGVLMVEAIAQAGVMLVLLKREPLGGRNTLFAGIEGARFRRQVRPGERLTLQAEVLAGKASVYRIHGKASVQGEVCCEATVVGALR